MMRCAKKGTLIQSMPSARDTCFGFLKIKIPYTALTRQTACVHNKENTESSRLGQQEKLKRGETVKTIIMMGVIVTFLVSIFTAGYDSKAGKE